GGAGTLALTGNMKQMKSEYARGVSFRGYGVSLGLGVGIPIPILNEEILKRTCVRDRDILAPVVDYSNDYPQNNGKVIAHVNYEQLRSGEIEVEGKKIAVGSLSSYKKALEIAHIVADEVRRGDFRLAEPIACLPKDTAMKPLTVREKS
ncbi:MAG TPA: homocysteine biosynthesis protein, partial [Thermoguttaceae bacterium]|nr:homocysteine biosynthesis protein [Thermoguttaceae bacterium]